VTQLTLYILLLLLLLLLQELGDMEPELRGFVMDEYMCKQRHDWPEGLKFPSQCLLSCMRSIRSVLLGRSWVH
jgi:hypothetical protein